MSWRFPDDGSPEADCAEPIGATAEPSREGRKRLGRVLRTGRFAPALCDVQALASTSYFGTPRRTVGGADTGRVALLLAVLEKRANQKTYNQDVYINGRGRVGAVRAGGGFGAVHGGRVVAEGWPRLARKSL